MAYEDGEGFKQVKIVDGAGDKNYVKVKQVDDTSVKNYVSVKESDELSKDYINVMVVDYDSPKDYLNVNFIGGAVVTTRWVPELTGSQYFLTDGYSFNGSFYIEFEVITSQVNSDWAVSDSSTFSNLGGSSLIYMDNPDGLQIIIPYGEGDIYRYFFGGQLEVCNGERHKVRLERVVTEVEEGVFSAIMNMWIDGSIFSSVSDVTTDEITISTRLFGGVSRYLIGNVFNIDINGDIAIADEPYAEYPELATSSGSTFSAVNFQSENVVEITDGYEEADPDDGQASGSSQINTWSDINTWG